jgi:hypothetical protein
MAEPLEGELMEREVDSGSALMQINASEINQQIVTAKKFPRSIKEFVREATEMATLSEQVAMECMYSLKRKDKDGSVKVIEGPSARMAEIVASAWGNCRAGARVIGEDDRFVTAQGAFIDLQRNVAITYEVKRRISGKYGKFSDDMIGVTANAACSIALRNAVFKGVPKAFWNEIFQKARQTAIGDSKSLAKRRGDMLAAFGKMGVSADEVYAYLGVPGEADISLDHIGLLIGVYQAIKEGETDVDQTFRPKTEEAGKVGESSVGAKFGKGKTDTQGNAQGDAGNNAAASGSAGTNNDVQFDEAALGKEFDLCKSKTSAKSIYDRYCSPDATYTEEQRTIVSNLYEIATARIQKAADDAGKKNKPGEQKNLVD